MVMPDIAVTTFNPALESRAKDFAANWGLHYEFTSDTGLALVLDEQGLSLQDLDDKKMGAVIIDFASDALTYRRQSGSLRKEAIAKAVGLKGDTELNVLDATAGLGRDAFMLASLGANVTMLERSAVVSALLQDALLRAKNDDILSQWLPSRLSLLSQFSLLENDWSNERPDVVYLDPMFPHKKKSALVKKEMRLLQQLLGQDVDADALLKPALSIAKNRVVVKRPDYAGFLADQPPTMQIKGKKLRFDVYLTKT